ncbi:MAG: transglutaminase-like domain-containing protein [Planctomycetota bacterium]
MASHDYASPTFSVIPVVGDGKWVWTEAPSETGYLEPRDYRLRVGIQLEATGDASEIKATTPVPAPLPEQAINETEVRSEGCQARLRSVGEAARQLVLQAARVQAGQTLSAMVDMHLTLRKQFLGHAKEQFPESQPKVSRDFRKLYLTNSPGIQLGLKELKQIATEVASQHTHPWDRARACYAWVWEHITPRLGDFTSVKRALRERVGDCEERAAVFVALCRALQIPARLVWVPNHNWAEFNLVDAAGQSHWIPAHTASYSWFGWTGAHELVLQKGDRLSVPEKRQPQRLLADWMQWKGSRPRAQFLAEIEPLAATEDADPGPGARKKDANGEWKLQRKHHLDGYLRDASE